MKFFILLIGFYFVVGAGLQIASAFEPKSCGQFQSPNIPARCFDYYGAK